MSISITSNNGMYTSLFETSSQSHVSTRHSYNTMSGLLAEQRAVSSSNFGRILLQLKYMREKHLLPASLTIGMFMEFAGGPPELWVKNGSDQTV